MNNYDPVAKGIMQGNLGGLQEEQGEFETAKQSYFDAIAAFDAALLIQPDDTRALKCKASALMSLGDVQEKLSERQESLKNWQEALKTYNRFLGMEPHKERIRYIRDGLQKRLDNLDEDTASS
ncbi:hypothetical protein Q5691_16850 [Microcoleus sp. w1-18aA5]|uniref:hypothetical protein n=1 Tax=unclassified Microcoleus TaxID=2642155 RepID=UPI002FD69D97